jgi:hypothetical protein
MLQTVKAAGSMDGSRLRSVVVGPTAARVGILSEDLAAVVYTMEAPGSKYTACNCPVSMQGNAPQPCQTSRHWGPILHCEEAEKSGGIERPSS